MRTITAVDLFCGAGGSSTGLAQLCADSTAGKSAFQKLLAAHAERVRG